MIQPSVRGRMSRALRDPRVACALAAVVVRAAVTAQAWARNPGVTAPRLDAAYYLEWAGDIAGGDLLGRGGTVGGEPFLLNPLYAYVIAPLVAAFGRTPAPVLVAQVLLGGATAALAADAARRWAGRVAAWCAGLGAAFSTALVHLDGYVAVSGLAAVLVAGTCRACAPAEPGERGHGPLAAGVWLGLAALARPVALFALPFVAWLHARQAERRTRTVLLVFAPFALCAGLSFARNLAAGGEAVVFTAANGQNLYLGNNPGARRVRAMTTDEFRFSPKEMHEDAKYRVAWETHREPSRGEVSDWYAERAWREFREAPADSLGWYATKLRWFFTPEEPASSADIDWDRRFAPLLRLAFVPTWVLAAFAAAGALVARRRGDLLLGPGSLVIAHVAACTVTFPLSHYRSPAVPAMAVLAGVGLATAWDALLQAKGRAAAVLALGAVGVAVVGAAEPQPAYQRHVLLMNAAVWDLEHGDLELAESEARAALEIEPRSLGAMGVLMDAAKASYRFEDARVWARKLEERQPWNPLWRAEIAEIQLELGRRDEALAAMDKVVAEFPWSGEMRGRRGELRCKAGDLVGARADLVFALDRRASPAPWALERCGLR